MNGAFPGKGRVSLEQEEVCQVRMARDILTKALGFVASESTEEMPAAAPGAMAGCGMV